MNKLRVFTAFSGYDSQCMALDKARIEYELVGWSEIDKFAIKAHNFIYPQWAKSNYGDISKIIWETVPDFDLFTYSFPCTDISQAGSKKGLAPGSRTHSSLLWECERAIIKKRPPILVMENVKALFNKKNMPYFQKWLDFLSDLGYANYCQVLDATGFGVPQHRERSFVVSIRAGQEFEFPAPSTLTLRLSDILETDVDKKYFLKKNTMEGILQHCKKKQSQGCGFSWHFSNGSDVSRTITGKYGQRQTDTYIDTAKIIQIGNFVENSNYKNPIRGRVYDSKGICPTLNTGQGGGRIPQITQDFTSVRRLTPTEYFRLMGVSEDNIKILVNSGISNKQLYKMAGNSIVVNVLCEIFKNLLK